jgi:hypothetical protein
MQNLVLKSSNSLNRTKYIVYKLSFPNLETERLILRRVDKDDVESIREHALTSKR